MQAQQPYPKMYLYHRLVKAKMFIDAHYNESIDLDNISDEAYFSKFHFIREFKKVYGKTPHQYLIQVRIDKAKELLKNADKVNEVCFEVGFESITSFTTLFKKMSGQTPSQYQFQQKVRQQLCNTQPFQFIPGCYAAAHGWKKNSNFQEATV